ncbi:hypothetical protein [Butyrivibrio sp. INlla16]|uniref:hypothetical protein n=1 Tax=Butyrivibrio sp. INlla16 TaxID=1520807 RepID=UPI0008925495|nr:hypothetical protein [Butyrivibrio sp. INlla16]SDB37927.1 hypothetical protein SAMN02910263_01837 [Butyrivibrio sp. INlla16]
MDYYAATLREPGEKLNNDGLLVKGIHLKDRSDLVVMVLSSCGANKKLSDRIIRNAEKLIHKGYDKDVPALLQRLFKKFGHSGFLVGKSTPDITVLVMKGINYYAMNRGCNRVMRIGRLGATDLFEEDDVIMHGQYYYLEGRLPEGSTLIAANSAFFERQRDTEIHRRLCPQMCVGNNEMQKNIEYLRSQLWSRGEKRPVTAAAVCVK